MGTLRLKPHEQNGMKHCFESRVFVADVWVLQYQFGESMFVLFVSLGQG